MSGTLGALASLIASERLSLHRADRLLQTMVENGYRSPVTTLAGLI